MDDETSQRKPLLSGNEKHKYYTDSVDSSFDANVQPQKLGVTFKKHITLFGAIGILTGIRP